MLIVVMNLVIGLTFFFSGVLSSTGFVWFAILTGISGIAGAIWNSSFVVILQTKIDNDKLGRVFSTYDSLALLPSVPGLLATGYIAEYIGLSYAFIISGLIVFVLGILIWMIPSVRALGKSTKKRDIAD